MFTPINSFFFQNLMLTHREKSFSKFNVCTPGNEFFQNSMFTHQKMLFFKMQCSHTWKTFFRNWMITHQDLHFKKFNVHTPGNANCFQNSMFTYREKYFHTWRKANFSMSFKKETSAEGGKKFSRSQVYPPYFSKKLATRGG